MSSLALALPPQTMDEPSLIRAGDTVIWQRRFDDYSATAYALSYVFVSLGAQINVPAVASVDVPDAFIVQVPGLTTAQWVPGDYRWQAYIKDSLGNRVTVDQGTTRVEPNFEVAATGIDDRDSDEMILAGINTLLAGKVLAGDAQKYMIHGRELQRYTFAELEKLRGQYALRVRQARVRRGERVSSRTVRTGFGG